MTRTSSHFASRLIVIAFVVVVFVFLAAGIVALRFTLSSIVGEDSWRHYSTGGELLASAPSVSPDGRYLAYTNPSSGNGDVFLFDSRDGTHHRLTSSPQFETQPIYSPRESRLVYFVRESAGRRLTFAVDTASKVETQITFGDFTDDILEISDDGTLMLIRRSQRGLGAGKSSLVVLVDLRRAHVDPVKIGASAAFVNRGRSIVFNPSSNPFEAYVRDCVSSNANPIGYGSVLSTNGESHVLVAKSGFEAGTSDFEIGLLNIDEGTEVALGKGRSAGFISRKHVLILRGFDQRGSVFDTTTGKTASFSVPEGSNSPPRMSKDMNRAFIWSHESSRRRFVAYEVDTHNEKLVELFSVGEKRSLPQERQ